MWSDRSSDLTLKESDYFHSRGSILRTRRARIDHSRMPRQFRRARRPPRHRKPLTYDLRRTLPLLLRRFELHGAPAADENPPASTRLYLLTRPTSLHRITELHTRLRPVQPIPWRRPMVSTKLSTLGHRGRPSIEGHKIPGRTNERRKPHSSRST